MQDDSESDGQIDGAGDAFVHRESFLRGYKAALDELRGDGASAFDAMATAERVWGDPDAAAAGAYEREASR